MKRNFKPGLRRDIDRINAENGLPTELPPAPPPLPPVAAAVVADDAEIVSRFNKAIASDTVLPFKVLKPATPLPITPAAVYPLHRDADTE